MIFNRTFPFTDISTHPPKKERKKNQKLFPEEEKQGIRTIFISKQFKTTNSSTMVGAYDYERSNWATKLLQIGEGNYNYTTNHKHLIFFLWICSEIFLISVLNKI